jgi:hypothetical protein
LQYDLQLFFFHPLFVHIRTHCELILLTSGMQTVTVVEVIQASGQDALHLIVPSPIPLIAIATWFRANAAIHDRFSGCLIMGTNHLALEAAQIVRNSEEVLQSRQPMAATLLISTKVHKAIGTFNKYYRYLANGNNDLDSFGHNFPPGIAHHGRIHNNPMLEEGRGYSHSSGK